MLGEFSNDGDLDGLFSEDELAAVGETIPEPERVADLSQRRRLMGGGSTVKVVLAVEDVAVVEQALRQANSPNRGKALMEICRHYLNPAGLVDDAT